MGILVVVFITHATSLRHICLQLPILASCVCISWREWGIIFWRLQEILGFHIFFFPSLFNGLEALEKLGGTTNCCSLINHLIPPLSQITYLAFLQMLYLANEFVTSFRGSLCYHYCCNGFSLIFCKHILTRSMEHSPVLMWMKLICTSFQDYRLSLITRFSWNQATVCSFLHSELTLFILQHILTTW